MTKRMLIDATHPEETRVVVVNANRLDEFDFETSTKKQLKGNIYLAKVTRVEPSLQAAFVDYGGNRHGFLAFNEIHPDYWRIPIADREAVLAEHRAAQEESEHDDDQRTEGTRSSANGATDMLAPESIDSTPAPFESRPDDFAAERSSTGDAPSDAVQSDTMHTDAAHPDREPSAEANSGSVPLEHKPWFTVGASPEELRETAGTPEARAPEHFESASSLDAPLPPSETAPAEGATGEPLPQDAQSPVEGRVATREIPTTIESIGGDDMDEVETETRRRYRPLRHYKIQEVIKRRQVLLVQVVKEERGTKGAALTTYLSLAGRYCVLMPNTARGGGISRRITSAQDRKRLKNIMEDLAVPDGMAVILRTAGMERNKAEIKRDYEYLVRQWDDIRELTLKSTAPSLVYEEGNLVKRAIRDLYSRDIEEILVEGEEGHKAAKAFMRTLMPSHVGRIQLYNDPAVPLFQRFQVEAQLDEMHGPTVRLRSGGYIVINPTEALVSIDVNSGRATRERHIEETALKTNLEAADEIARQLRLRDLAGLIVIDFIDMEDNRNQHAVERRLKEAMKSDRARIQIGRISPFGLLELSRQRLRPSLQEVSSERCPHCGGSGLVRSTESTALHVLRAIEEEGMKLRTAEATVHVPTPVALYMLNHKRDALASMETRFGLHVAFSRDDTLIPPAYRLERTRARTAGEMIGTAPASVPIAAPEEIEAPVEAAHDHREEEVAEELAAAPGAPEPMEEGDGVDGNGHRRRRRRRRRRGRGDDRPTHAAQGGEWRGPDESAVPAVPTGNLQPAAPIEAEPNGDAAFGQEVGNGRQPTYQGDGDGSRRRRRGRRGGRRRGRRGPDMPGTPGENPLSDPRYPDAAAPLGEEGMSMPYSEPVVAAPAPTAPPPLERPRRIEGPGDAYDWPWNRRAERFPDEQQAEAQPAAAPMPSPVSEPPPRIEPPAPVVQAQAPAAVAPPPPQQVPEPPVSSEPPPPEQPSGPPRRGWWRRLTS